MINHLIKNHPEMRSSILELLKLDTSSQEAIPTFTSTANAIKSRNDLYKYMHNFFENECPKEIKMHRSYFNTESRGFGEDAFHAMWLMLLNEYKPKSCLEIGVYRGQIITLWGLIAKLKNIEIDIHGISPFSSSGDTNSTYLSNIDYYDDTINSVNFFGLPQPSFLRSLSTEPIAKAYIKSKSWDLIYIDGSHDYEVVLSDYTLSVENLSIGGILVMDDSSLYTDYEPHSASFAGHPGPSKVATERAMNELRFLGGVGHNNVFQKNYL